MPNWKQDPVDILGIGDALVDLSTHAPRIPPRGGNVWSTALTLSAGGTTANVAANAARLGIRSGFVGCVGDDPYGHYLVAEFEKVGVDTRGMVVRAGTFTGIVLAIIDDEGERTFIACAKGASHTALLPQDLQALDYASIRVIHTSGVCLVEEPSRSALLGAMKRAREAGCLIYYDPNLRLEGDVFPPDLGKAQMKAVSYADTVLIGDEEMGLLLGAGTCREGADLLRKEGVKLVVAKQGSQGATAYSEAGEDHCPAFKVAVVSTAGAGDSFDAAFIAARQRGAGLHQALEYACAAAAIKVTRQGARSVPEHADVLAFLDEHRQPSSQSAELS